MAVGRASLYGGWKQTIVATLASVVLVVASNFVLPDPRLGDAGLYFFLAVLAFSYWLGMVPALLGTAVIVGFIAASGTIPGTVFYHLPKQEARVIGTAVLFLCMATVIPTVRWRLKWAHGRADFAEREKERESELRRQKEEELRHSEETRALIARQSAELAEKNDELEGFTHAISHDMRSSLRAIVAHSRFVLEDEGPRMSEEGRDSLERLAAAALKLSVLVDDLLRYAQLGNLAMARESVDISKLAEAIRADLRTESPSASITVEPGMRANCDPTLVSLVLQNLIYNACKFVKPGETPNVTVGEAATERGTAFFVRDRGIGIEEAQAQRLFRPFERIHSAADYPGTGIGLANVKRCVDRHGGSVWIESTPGEGTTFWFTLDCPSMDAVAGALPRGREQGSPL